MIALIVALVITGAGLAWVLVTASRAAFAQVAVDGGAAAVAIAVAVAVAVYFAQVARTAVRNAAALDHQVRQQEREFGELAQETLPLIARRVRDGVSADDVFVSIPRPDSTAVRTLLTTLQLALSTLLDDASAAQRTATAALAERAGTEAEAARLAEETIPGAIARLRAGEPRDTALADVERPVSPALDGLLDEVVSQIAAAERRSSAAMVACASAAARIQAQTTRMLAELREMQVRYGDDKVFGDLMELDHRVSQTGRLADSIALLAGGRSGRRWTKPIPMESILRGAMGRIDAYQRVRLHSTSTAALAGYAAESVMHALAELMDNAAAFSAHGSEVHVFVEEEDAGIVVTIDDSGLGMRRRERDRAEELVSQPLDLATLPGTRLGLAVVGRVATRYGVSVSFRPSSRGGTGVVLLLPRRLISQKKDEVGWNPDAARTAVAAAPAGPSALPAGSAALPARHSARATGGLVMGGSNMGASDTGGSVTGGSLGDSPRWSPPEIAVPEQPDAIGQPTAATAVPEPSVPPEPAVPAEPPARSVFEPASRYTGDHTYGEPPSDHSSAGGFSTGGLSTDSRAGDGDEMSLPIRPRGRTLAQTMRSAPGESAAQDSSAAQEHRPARTAGARFAAFRASSGRSRDGGPSASMDPGPGNEEDGTEGSA